MSFLGFGKQKDSTPPSAAERYAQAGREAMELGDFVRAVEYFRTALEYAPLSRELRGELSDALLEKALASERKKAPRQNRKSAVLPEVKSEPPRARPRKRPNGPRRGEMRAAREALSRALHSPGMAAADAAEEAALTLAAAETPRPMPRRRTRRGGGMGKSSRRRMWTMGAIYGGALMILAGAAHGLISRAINDAALPEVTEVRTIPAGLASVLEEAGELLGDKQPQKAFVLLEGVLDDYPDFEKTIESAMVQALRAEGSAHLSDRDYEKAADAFERATRVQPLTTDNWIDLARALREGGRTVQASKPATAKAMLERASNAYQRALDVEAANPAALYGIAQVHLFLDERNAAVSQLKRLVAAAPDSPEARKAERDLEQLTGRRS